jgi:hypothetical protein
MQKSLFDNCVAYNKLLFHEKYIKKMNLTSC